MLEIILLIYLARQIGNLAERKGLKKGLWKFYMVLAWLGGLFLGIFLGMISFGPDNVIGALLTGYAIAVTNYFLLKSILSKKPDAQDQPFDFENRQSE